MIDDARLDTILLDADPADVRAVRAIADSAAAGELRRDITTVTPIRRHRRRFAVIAAAAAAAVAVPIALTLVHPSSSDSAYGAALVHFAERSPRLLVGAPGWKVADTYEESAGVGEMHFARAGREFDVYWVPGAHAKDSDKHDFARIRQARIDGAQAWLGATPMRGGGLDIEALWAVGGQTREARGTFASRAAFLAVAQTLHRVDVDTWLGAMPASVVTPAGRARTVDRMLADIPQPRGFDRRRLTDATNVLDRYQLGATVTGAVTCSWVRQWSHGTSAQRAEAAEAMATSRRWKILNEMEKQGAYPDVVWEIADYMNGHQQQPLGPNNSWTLEQWAKPALGC